jgi:hypothetical protein
MQIGSVPVDYTASTYAAQGVTPPPQQQPTLPTVPTTQSAAPPGDDHDRDHNAPTVINPGQQVNVIA